LGRYDVEWKIYRRLRTSALLLAVGLVPFIGLAYFLNQVAHAKTLLSIVVILYAALFFTTQLRLTFFLCPRCHKWFATTWLFNRGLFARKCVHCGLRKFSNGEEQVDPGRF
jgi:hypothetical protein